LQSRNRVLICCGSAHLRWSCLRAAGAFGCEPNRVARFCFVISVVLHWLCLCSTRALVWTCAPTSWQRCGTWTTQASHCFESILAPIDPIGRRTPPTRPNVSTCDLGSKRTSQNGPTQTVAVFVGLDLPSPPGPDEKQTSNVSLRGFLDLEPAQLGRPGPKSCFELSF
jgi:hypothetical protein